jgi:thiol-disulfide isomerase/thioredoxin
MPLATYARLVGKTPYVGAIVDLNPYFKSEVKAVTAEVVVVVALAENGSHTDELGTVDIRVGDTEVTMVANPKPGAVFAMENLQGKVTAVDDKSFTVDFNHPLAGKAYTLEFEVVSLVKRSALAGLTIAWIEDHDKGMAQAAKTGKPVVMVLWADWCQYCEKLLNDVMPDPRIGELKDRFVWVKINSDKEKQVKALYDQRGFPLTLVLTAKGEVLHSIDGLTDAKSLRRQLTGVLNQIKLGKAVTPKPAQKG